MFRDNHPLAWTFHRNTSRWTFNMQALSDKPNPQPLCKEYLSASSFVLPDPCFPKMSLEDALSARLSCRRFTEAPLQLVELATLLKGAYGVSRSLILGEQEFLERSVPSGGGLYPLEIYVLAQQVQEIEPGIYHYAALSHVLEQIRLLPLPRLFISDLFLGQPYISKGAAILVFTTLLERSLWKYGDRGYRYILLEAGHAAQNLNLLASAMDLASLNLGGFFDHDLAHLLDLDIELEVPLYAVVLGVPAGSDRSELRQPVE